MNELVESLLYEGYALYPYTPGATKNATPTPFGIVYPPAYARQLDTTFDHLELQCVVEGDGESPRRCTSYCRAVSGTSRRRSGSRVRATSRSANICAHPTQGVRPLESGRQICGGFRSAWRTARRCPEGLERGEALRHSLISTHPVLRVDGGRFISQLDAPCESVNTWPVLASPEDDVMLGAAIILPDHPQIAPESRGNLFDNTEIEEALVLHVQVLSDEERAEIEQQDPAVREMIERASAVTSEELHKLHGRVELRDPVTREPPKPSADVRDPTRGLPEVEVDGVISAAAARVVVRPGLDADLQARMLEGRTVTVERIYRDYDGRVHLGVSVDQPGQEIMRETGRFLWFFPPEVEVLQ